MPETLTKLAYQATQQGKSYFSLAHKVLGSRLRNIVNPPNQAIPSIPTNILLEIQGRLDRVLTADWEDAEQGVYPTSLLFDAPWEEFLLYYPAIWWDMPQIWERANRKQYQDFSPEIETSGYPDYYVQTFHHQTDGYLSETSANLYDVQVELLFNGGADAMRRRILAPLKQGLQAAFGAVEPNQIRILDVACGTGRTLKMLRGMLPKASLYGLDLSPAYLRKANQLMSQNPGELPQLIQANAEDMPYKDSYFHAISCVFTFHELPPQARQNVIEQCFRVLQPGGTFVICDSIQTDDSPEMAPVMQNFSAVFHEPYYRHYVTDNLVERLQTAGFTHVETQVHYMSKYLIARKPGDSAAIEENQGV
jgi:ubiquinone/menaquinone biosynthesis C-methylase UbiE